MIPIEIHSRSLSFELTGSASQSHRSAAAARAVQGPGDSAGAPGAEQQTCFSKGYGLVVQQMKPRCITNARPVVYGLPVSCISYTFLTAPALRTDLRLTSDRPICVWTYRLRKTIHNFSRNHVYHFRNMQEPYTRQPVREVISICAGALLCMTDRESAIDTQIWT